MYTLYFSRKDKVIQVKKAKKALQNLEYSEKATQYNSCYYICSKRAPLLEKAKEIKQKWITELEDELKVIKEIKV